VSRPRPHHRRLGNVDADRRRPGIGDQRSEVTGTATEVQHTVIPPQSAEQERAPAREIGRGKLVGKLLPKLLVVLLHGATVSRRTVPAIPPDIHRLTPLQCLTAMTSRLLAVAPVDHPGGAEIHLLRLLAGLSTRGWEITLTTPSEGPLRRQAAQAGYAWQSLDLGGLARGAGLRALLSWPRARRLAADADVVYLNGTVCGRLLPALGPGAARRVLHVHDMVTRVPRFWRRADAVLADSQAVADRLTGLRPHVVYGPVDPEPPVLAAPWPTGNRPVIGFVGRIEPRKGPLDLARAAPAIRLQVPGARVVVVGDDPYGSDATYTRAVTSSPEIEHYPWSDNAPGLMRHLDVLVLPSYEEPFGTVLAEAMAVGTPVVATRVGGLAEVVEDGVSGRLVEPGRPDLLAEAVLDVLAHRAEMGAAARAGASRFFLADYVDHVERLIAA
jgi:glycosyltransferase involved in cell wall biosynthesis